MHAWAILELKKYFGDSKGLSKKLKTKADNIIREASGPHEWVQPFVGNPDVHVGMGGFQQQYMQPPFQQGGVCFSFQQPGHLSRNCANVARAAPRSASRPGARYGQTNRRPFSANRRGIRKGRG